MLEYSIFYAIFAFCFVFPPSAFVSAGLTIAQLFDSCLGSEDLQFVPYQLRRTCITLIVHSYLPLGYFMGLLLTEGWEHSVILIQSPFWGTLLCLSVLFHMYCVRTVSKWKANNWEHHPIVKTLASYAGNGRQWNDVAVEINAQFRSIEKVSVRTNPVSKTVITNSWIIKVEPYTVHLAHQNHVALQLVECDEHTFTPDRQVAQFLSVRVEHVQTHQFLFMIRLNARDYADVQDRLQSPIANVRGVVVNPDLHARFSKVFIEEVQQNPSYRTHEELDSCLGCAINKANVRLVRRCSPLEGSSGCSPCFCRPMWCLNCLSKWFSARQDIEHPETWLSSRCPCPTCRSPFCVLDVSIVEQVDEI